MDMPDDDQNLPCDPASLPPFVCELIAASPDVVMIPDSEQYLGAKSSDETVTANSLTPDYFPSHRQVDVVGVRTLPVRWGAFRPISSNRPSCDDLQMAQASGRHHDQFSHKFLHREERD
jgi:hypothetical protein